MDCKNTKNFDMISDFQLIFFKKKFVSLPKIYLYGTELRNYRTFQHWKNNHI